ncbi:hypothetical protein HOG98_04970 [bacterium]|jgi:hypothetical protein|nr:hypothetical protein [bacterium]
MHGLSSVSYKFTQSIQQTYYKKPLIRHINQFGHGAAILRALEKNKKIQEQQKAIPTGSIHKHRRNDKQSTLLAHLPNMPPIANSLTEFDINGVSIKWLNCEKKDIEACSNSKLISLLEDGNLVLNHHLISRDETHIEKKFRFSIYPGSSISESRLEDGNETLSEKKTPLILVCPFAMEHSMLADTFSYLGYPFHSSIRGYFLDSGVHVNDDYSGGIDYCFIKGETAIENIIPHLSILKKCGFRNVYINHNKTIKKLESFDIESTT